MTKYWAGFSHGFMIAIWVVLMGVAVDVMINGFWIIERAY